MLTKVQNAAKRKHRQIMNDFECERIVLRLLKDDRGQNHTQNNLEVSDEGMGRLKTCFWQKYFYFNSGLCQYLYTSETARFLSLRPLNCMKTCNNF